MKSYKINCILSWQQISHKNMTNTEIYRTGGLLTNSLIEKREKRTNSCKYTKGLK
jgi:hypothetical protein